MTPRERFLTAISRGTPDRAPRYAELTPRLLEMLKEKTGYDDPAEYFDYEMRTVGFHRTQAKGDFSAYLGELPPGSSVGEWGVADVPADLFHLSIQVHPMRDFTSVKQVESYPFPDIPASYRHQDLEQRVAAVHARGLAVVSDWTTIFEQSWYLRGLETFIVDMLERPAIAEAILDRVTDIACLKAKRQGESGADLVRTGDDIGTQRGMMMSPDLWRLWLKPRLARLIAAAKAANPAVKVLYDSDGNFDPVIPDLIEVGVDVLAPIQPECNDPAKLKREYSGHLAFWGSLGVQSTLPFGTVCDIRREVRTRMQTIGQGGGLVIAPSHVIPPESPWENVLALFAAMDEFGGYS